MRLDVHLTHVHELMVSCVGPLLAKICEMSPSIEKHEKCKSRNKEVTKKLQEKAIRELVGQQEL